MAKRLLFIFTPQMALFFSLKQPSSLPRGNELGQQEDREEIEDSACSWGQLRTGTPAAPAPGQVDACPWPVLGSTCRPKPRSPTRGGQPGSHCRSQGQPPSWAGRPRHERERPHSYCFVYCFHFLILSLVFHCMNHIYDYILANGKTIQLILQSSGQV